MAFISIIIPVYNAEKYLSPCIESIQGQSFTDFEVVLIDDGSTDSSGTLCDSYAQKDARIRVIHKQNAGTSAARNTGIHEAQGTYLTFMDNDDFWFDVDGLKYATDLLMHSNAELLMHPSLNYDDPHKVFVEKALPSLSHELLDKSKAEILQSIISQGLMSRSVWNKIVSRKVVIENEIFFPENMRNEDTDWTGTVLRKVNSIAWLDTPFYAYRKGHDYAQTSKPLPLKSVDDLAHICLKQVREIQAEVDSPAEQGAYFAYLAYPYSVWMGQAALFGKIYAKSTAFSDMKNIRFLIDYDADPAVKKVKLASKILGFNNTCRLLGVFLKKKYRNLEVVGMA